MTMPWADKTGLAKAATIFAVLLLVSLGLCGANAVLFARLASMGGGAAMSQGREGVSVTLIVTAYAESLGILVGVVGLLIVGLIAVVRAIYRVFRRAE